MMMNSGRINVAPRHRKPSASPNVEGEIILSVNRQNYRVILGSEYVSRRTSYS